MLFLQYYGMKKRDGCWILLLIVHDHFATTLRQLGIAKQDIAVLRPSLISKNK